jgi:hypothetical protein
MTEGERLALDIIRNVRAALGTPDEMDVTHHAAQVVAEAQRAREDLAQAQADAARWRAVPWDEICDVIASWELDRDMDDAMYAVRKWYDTRNKPKKVQA